MRNVHTREAKDPARQAWWRGDSARKSDAQSDARFVSTTFPFLLAIVAVYSCTAVHIILRSFIFFLELYCTCYCCWISSLRSSTLFETRER